MNIDFNVQDALAEAEERFAAYGEAAVDALGQSLVMLGENTMAYAKEFTVPVYTGYLRSTGWVDPSPDYGSNSIEVTLGFSADYAAEQEIAGNNPGYRKDRPSAGRRYMRRAMLHTLVDAERLVTGYMMERLGKI